MTTPLLPLDEALARLGQIEIPEVGKESIVLSAGLGRVLAHDIVAPFDLPGFDNSAVDGFAIKTGAGKSFTLSGSSFAGQPYASVIKPGMAVRIATGAAVPQGADAIAMLEICTERENVISLEDLPEAGAHIRKAGQDVRQGVTVLKAGTRLDAASLAMGSSLGVETLDVRRRLTVAIASTGSEVVASGERQPGQIYDSNRILLRSLLQPYGVEIIDLGIVPDDPHATRAALIEGASRAHLIITSGGVSVGVHDHVREVVEQTGNVVFWRLAIKPGKPLLCGSLVGTPILAVPGNPVSAFVTFHLVCRPLLLRLMGMTAKPPLRIPVRMGFTHKKSAALREFARVTLNRGQTGLVAEPFRSQLSNLVSSLLESDGIVDLPVGSDSVTEGETVNFIPWSGFAL